MSLLYELMHRNVNVFSLSIFIVENAHYNTIDIFYRKASHTEDFIFSIDHCGPPVHQTGNVVAKLRHWCKNMIKIYT